MYFCISPPPNVLILVLGLCLSICKCVECGGSARKPKYLTYNLTDVCPQVRPGSGVITTPYTENDVYRGFEPDIEVLRLGLGVAAFLEETVNHSIFAHIPSSLDAIDCTFEVNTGPESRGIFVVLSHLNALRRWRNGSCQDFVQIIYANFHSESICGDPVGVDSQSIRSFDSGVGAVQIRLHLDNSDKQSRPDLKLRLKLVFTSYFDCAKEPDAGFSCTNTNERCIPKEYVRDGIINCGVPNCRDEANCYNIDFDTMYNNLSITILIGLVSFISTGLLFGLVLWCCLKRSFKQRQAAPTAPTIELQLSSTNFESPSSGGSREHRRSSSAGGGSALEGATGTTSVDPPPSYDILFPDK